ncbi:MAG: ribbon-helix-helix protein, CopG family [Desulfobacterales bacterium]|nr:ribbon-helix-helix protein, CopG family [Desulfobacterales bacterium]
MAQVTIYLDPETERRMNALVKKSGISKSKWISRLIREKTAERWPETIREMAGSWGDFPSAEEIRAGMGEDGNREPV